MRDNRRLADGLDAAGRSERRHVPQHATAREVDDDEPRLLVRGHENHGRAPFRERARRERERGGSDDEPTAVHTALYGLSGP